MWGLVIISFASVEVKSYAVYFNVPDSGWLTWVSIVRRDTLVILRCITNPLANLLLCPGPCVPLQVTLPLQSEFLQLAGLQSLWVMSDVSAHSPDLAN